MEEWKEYKAIEFCKTVTDGTHDSPKPKDYGYYLITSKHLKGSGIDFTSAYHISEEDYLKVIARSKVEQYDILYSMIGTIGNIVQVKEENVNFAVKNMGIFKMGKNYLKSSWLLYWLKSPMAGEYVSQRLAGSTQSYLTLKTLRDFPVLYPGDSIANNIVSILKSLDDKIEINRRINENLEQQAQALFKSWFVDFEPFRNQPFVESELGMIPEGWRVVNLHEIVDIKRDNYKKGDDVTLPYLPIDIIPMHSLGITEFKDNNEAQSSLQTFEKNDIVIGAMRVYFHRVVIAPCKGITRNTCFVLKPKNQNLWAYGIMQCNQNDAIDFANRTSKGSTMPYAIWNNGFANYRIVLPDTEILCLFNKVLSPILEKIRDSYRINTTISQLRDTLLPRLMSGELKVNEIEQ